MPQNVFVGPIARRYDAGLGDMADAALLARTADVLAELAGTGGALEFAIGTGRVALPLAARGVQVAGLEISEDMVAELRAKPGGSEIPVTIGDMSATRVAGTFDLVYLVFNSIGNLLTQAEQVACFRNAAAHLGPGGRFLVELGVPDLRRMPPGQTSCPFDIAPEHLGFDTYDFADQHLTSHHVWFDGSECVRFDSHHRYAWPAELDLMAQLAGMDLVHRWADWERSPFTGESRSHVSVWARGTDGDGGTR